MTEIVAKYSTGNMIESVVIGGDLSRLTAEQRVSYYQQVCNSLGLNPLTRPFDYITLNGKLTLYARKDAADQLRKLHGVSVDDIEINEVGDSYFVKVKGHDATGRSDVEIGVVSKKDMQGNIANVQMKAVTKAKRRLTLSICGLGWLDETEIESIPDARPVNVTDAGVVVDITPEVKQPVVEHKGDNAPDPAPAGDYSNVCTDEGVPYAELKLADLVFRFNALSKKHERTPEDQRKLEAANYFIQKQRGASSAA